MYDWWRSMVNTAGGLRNGPLRYLIEHGPLDDTLPVLLGHALRSSPRIPALC